MLPPPSCSLCPRLVEFRTQNNTQHPGFFNGAVPSFGALDAGLLIVGLAPGLHGANATGRPFTGDFAGEILYPALLHAGLATQEPCTPNANEQHLHHYASSPPPHLIEPQTLRLRNTRISNAVRCVPPENKPTPAEIKTCNGFLKAEINAMPQLRVILSLGQISHQAVLQAFGLKASAYRFGHGAQHPLPLRGITLLDSYHTSRYNINTRRLSDAMFAEIIATAKAML